MTLTNNNQRRLSSYMAARPSCRPVACPALHKALRRVSRRSSRPVLKKTGPTIAQLFAAMNRAYNLAVKLEKKRNAPSRFQMLGTPEERECRSREDLERGYGPAALAARAAEQANFPKPAPAPAATPPVPQSPHVDTKKDIVQVPLPPPPPPRNRAKEPPVVRLINDLFGVK